MPSAVKEVKLQPTLEPAAESQTATALTPQQQGWDLVALFQQFVSDPKADVEKFERLVALAERVEARRAEFAFNTAMAAAQKDMRPVAADSYNEQTKSRYASYEALDAALRPIYTTHGFGLSFDTGDPPESLTVRVLCYVTHVGGHSKTYKVDMPADGKGAKGGDVMTRTHAAGSAMSYGMRYLLKLIFNIAVADGDDDGNKAARQLPDAPDGFDNWWADMELIGEEGLKALSDAWNKSKSEFKNHTAKHLKREWTALKNKAQRVNA